MNDNEWKTSSLCDSNQCVEVGVWKKSSLSSLTDSCVEVGVWQKSTRSGPHDDNCVEVAGAEDGDVLVRDTKDHGNGPVLRFTPDEWRAFIGAPGKGGAKDGEFDLD